MTFADAFNSAMPRMIRAVPNSLGLFLRIGRNDHGPLLDLLARGDAHFFGLVFEATAIKRHKELRERVLEANLDAILDLRTQAAATVGGYSEKLAALPWGVDHPHNLADFAGTEGRRRIATMASFAVDHAFTQMLAPTHLLSDSSDPWYAVDRESTRMLRQYLDRAGGHGVQILYSLAVPYATFRDDHELDAFIKTLAEVPADAIWLRIEGLGSDATSNGVRSYIHGANAFGSLKKPVVADGIGGLAGLSLLAFGAAGGIAHGVTFGERVDHSSWRRPRSDNGFGRARRVYVPEVDLLFEPEEAQALIRSSSRATSMLSCHDTRCCPRGVRDMLENPARHYLIQRMKQIGMLTRLPLPMRARQFVDGMVRPASDVLAQAENWKLKDDKLPKKIRSQRRRLDALRLTLAAHASHLDQPAALPKTRLARELRPGL